MSRSDSYMKSPEALYKKLNLLGEICFDLITFCQNERTCAMYLCEFLYPSLQGFWELIYTPNLLPFLFRFFSLLIFV